MFFEDNTPSFKALPRMVINHKDKNGKIVEDKWVIVKPVIKLNSTTNKWEKFSVKPEVSKVLKKVYPNASDLNQLVEGVDYDHKITTYQAEDFSFVYHFFKETNEEASEDYLESKTGA
jgi:hypothetical protein